MVEKLSVEYLLEHYRRHVIGIADDDELDVLALLVVTARDEIEDRLGTLTSLQRREVERVDEILAGKWRLMKIAFPPRSMHDRSRWWWFLHEGPQVREQAQRIAA
jgi:hypothetical protein